MRPSSVGRGALSPSPIAPSGANRWLAAALRGSGLTSRRRRDTGAVGYDCPRGFEIVNCFPGRQSGSAWLIRSSVCPTGIAIELGCGPRATVQKMRKREESR
jgi:hypothetical protein